VGASGAIYGILLAFGLAFPTAVIFVFFIPMPARIAVFVFGGISLLGIGGANVAHMAHLGGMVTGLAFLWFFTGGHPSQVPLLPGGRRRPGPGTYGHGSDGMPRSRAAQRSGLQNLVDSFHRWRTRRRMSMVNHQRTGDGRRPGNGRPGTSGQGERVDEILEKISREGLRSLSEEEQDILRRASRKD